MSWRPEQCAPSGLHAAVRPAAYPVSGVVASPAGDILSLTIDGRTYAGWTDIRVSRGLDRCATDFDISVSERWGATSQAWPIKPYSECVISIGRDPIMTGYVDAYDPSLDADSHHVRVRGRSRTQDLIDCTPDIKSGQFAGYTLEAIAVRSARCSTSASPWRRTGQLRRRGCQTRAIRNRVDVPGTALPPGRGPGDAMTRKAGSCSPGRGQRAPAAASSRARTS